MDNTKELEQRVFERINTSQYFSEDQRGKIYSAYKFSKEYFGDKVHKSGRTHVDHSLILADMLLDLKVDIDVLIVTFLHDIIKHTDVSFKDVMGEFGENIAELVKGVQRLGIIHIDESESQDAFLDVILKDMSRDIRVVIIRLMHKLYDLQTIEWRSKSEQKDLVKEALDFYVPIANRLGIGFVKTRIEDLCFKYMHPKIYGELHNRALKIKMEDDQCLSLIVGKLKDILEENKIEAEVKGRLKSLYGIYRKMLSQKKPLWKIMDKVALRIIADSIPRCYQILGSIHTTFNPIPGTFDDFIGLPKANNYQSLHTCIYPVKEISYKPVEIQIRTWKMHEEAEYGAAAHWKYKHKDYIEATAEEQLHWIRNLMKIKRKTSNPKDFVKTLKQNVYKDYLIIFDENGNVFHLPKGSTPINFAQIKGVQNGDMTSIKAKINGRFSDVDRKLADGDTVEIVV